MSVDTLRRERLAQRIGHLRLRNRVIRYTDEHLTEYLKANEVAPCRDGSRHAREASLAIGSASDPAAPCGAALGTTESPDKHALHLSALTILSRPNSRSRNG